MWDADGPPLGFYSFMGFRLTGTNLQSASSWGEIIRFQWKQNFDSNWHFSESGGLENFLYADQLNTFTVTIWSGHHCVVNCWSRGCLMNFALVSFLWFHWNGSWPQIGFVSKVIQIPYLLSRFVLNCYVVRISTNFLEFINATSDTYQDADKQHNLNMF